MIGDVNINGEQLVKRFLDEIVYRLELANGFDDLIRNGGDVTSVREYEMRRDMCMEVIEGLCNVAASLDVGDPLFRAMNEYESNAELRSRLNIIQNQINNLEMRIESHTASEEDLMTRVALQNRKDVLVHHLSRLVSLTRDDNADAANRLN